MRVLRCQNIQGNNRDILHYKNRRKYLRKLLQWTKTLIVRICVDTLDKLIEKPKEIYILIQYE